MNTTQLRTVGVAVVAVVASILIAGCSAAAQLMPGGGSSNGSYEIGVEFVSVLNIPDGANVLRNGNPVGRMTSVELGEKTATVYLAIDRGVRIEASTRVELRQTTILGDLYIALIPQAPSSGESEILRDGATIPLSQTVAPDNVETVMVGLSQFINGGFVGRAQQVIRDFNDAMPDDPHDLQRIASDSAKQLVDLGRSANHIDRLLQDSAAIVDQLARRRATIENVLVIGPDRFGRMQEMFMSVVGLIADLRYLTRPASAILVDPNVSDLMRVVSTIDPLLMTIAESDRTLNQHAISIRELLARKIQPFLSGRGQIDVRNIYGPDGEATKVADVLRAIGVV